MASINPQRNGQVLDVIQGCGAVEAGMKKSQWMRSVRETQMQRGGNGSVLQIQRHYFIWQLASLLMQIVSPDSKQRIDRRYSNLPSVWVQKFQFKLLQLTSRVSFG